MGLIFFVGGCATPDFKGGAFPSRAHAEAFQGKANEISASANIEYILGEISSFWITIDNHSAKQRVNIDYRFSEFWLVTTDGERRALIIPEAYLFPSTHEISPKGSATLQVRLGRPKVVREEIKMIECSFDLGKTRVFLLPNVPKSGKQPKSFVESLFR